MELRSRRFLRLLVLACASILILHGLALEVFTRIILVPNDVVAIKERHLLDKGHIDVIGLGDSHVLNGLYLDGPTFYNFGRGADTTPILYFKLKWLLKAGLAPKRLLLQFDYHMFSGYRTKPGDAVQAYAHIIDEPIDPVLGRYTSADGLGSSRLLSLSENYSPIVHRTLVRYLKGKLKPAQIDDNGHGALSGNWTEVSADKRALSTSQRLAVQVYAEPLIVPGLLEYYERTIELARSRGIEIVLIRYPLSNEYLVGIHSSVETEFQALADELVKCHEVKVLDYRKAFSDQQALFGNEDHLNEIGAKELGRLISADLEHLSSTFSPRP